MRLPLDWLREYVPWDRGAEELGVLLTTAGLEVEAIHRPGEQMKGILVGEVLEAGPHPDADRLTLCRVTTGTEPVSIVCGAPNVAAGQRVPVAMVGSLLPGGMKIKKTKIRGQVSHGMICSEAELELGEDAAGIMVLPDDAPVGKLFTEYMGFADEVLELEVPPNRPDALSIYGLARDVALLAGLPLEGWSADVTESGPPASEQVRVTVEDLTGCPRYTARLVRGVKNGQSPSWMASRLRLAGMRPINVIVDITNYIMLELGQPQHAFDLRRVRDGHIIVRRARNGERLVTLDEVERRLDPEVLLICDPDGPLAVAGVMGGADSEIGEDTTDILLESACFDPVRTSIAGGRLGLFTESRRRFERGTDRTIPGPASARAAALMAELAGGTVAAGLVEGAAEDVDRPRAVLVRQQQVDTILGAKLPEEEMREILSRAGFDLEEDPTGWNLKVPSWRPDISGEAHVAEEIARIHGYDTLGSRIRLTGNVPGGRNDLQRFREALRDELVGLGLNEVYTYSLVPADSPAPVTGFEQPVRLANPLSESLACMRRDLLPGLLEVVRHNLNRQVENVRIFEIGAVHQVVEGEALQEEWVAGALTGSATSEPWVDGGRALDWHDLRGLLQAMGRAMRLEDMRMQPYEGSALEQGRGVTLCGRDGAEVGAAGLLASGLGARYDLEDPVWVFAVRLEMLKRVQRPQTRYAGLPRYPASERDVSVVVGADVAVGNMIAEVGELDRVERVLLVDEYRGSQIPEGMKGVTLAVRYRHSEKTLSDKEIDRLHKTTVELLKTGYQARLRS